MKPPPETLLTLSRAAFRHALLVATLILSLLMNFWFDRKASRLFHSSVQVHQFWTQKLKLYRDYEEALSELNAPGNDVFSSKSTTKERLKLEQGIRALQPIEQTILEESRQIQDQGLSERLVADLEQISQSKDRMIALTHALLDDFDQGRKDRAAERMAEMDRIYGEIRTGFQKFHRDVRSAQDIYFRERNFEADRHLTFSWILNLINFGLALLVTISSLRKFLGLARSEKELREKEIHLQNALEQVAFYKHAIDQFAIVATTDPRGKITFANEQFCRISGYSQAELIGSDHRILNSGQMPPGFFREMWKTISGGHAWRGEICNRAKDGREYWVDTTIVPTVDPKGQVTHYTAIRYEITDRKRMESEAMRSHEKLVEANRAALAAAKAKSEFLANMSHEIRTPMNGIVGMCSLLLSSAHDRDQVEKLHVIQHCGASLLHLINDILDFSKLEVNRVELEDESFDLHQNIREVVQLLSSIASQKSILLSAKISNETPQWVRGDVTRFRQVLTNLVSNAVKFTEIGSVTVRTQAKTTESGKHELQVSVEDTGIGIPLEKQSKLFVPFSQVDASTTRKYGGTGLGLAISRGLCERMGGRIWLDSTPGVGSTFSFSLTLNPSEESIRSSDPNPFSQLPEQLGSTMPLRILVAEDNRVNQLVIQGLLEKLGYTPQIVSNGVEALNQVIEQSYDLVLMDCHMPEMDGFAATEGILKLLAAAPDRPRIYAVTASTLREDVERCHASGMDGVIAKPITLQALVAALSSAHARRRQERGPSPGSSAIQAESEPAGNSTSVTFDLSAFEKNFRGTDSLAEETIAAFLAYLPELVSAMDHSVQASDFTRLEKSAYMLQGACENIYAQEARARAIELQRFARAFDSLGSRNALARLKDEIRKLQSTLSNYLAEIRRQAA